VEKFLWISIGAVFGANLRYWLADWAAARWGGNFPYGTFLINMTGSFILGMVVALITDHYIIDPRLRVLITVGLLGSFTTFSTYTYESIALIQQGQWWLGLVNLFGSSLLGGLSALLGIWIGKLL
jgi:CrcB protein